MSNELYKELEIIREDAELSFADLIKLGAGIAQEEINEKLEEVNYLQDKIYELKQTIKQEQEKLNSFIETAREKVLAKLEKQYNVYTLFDADYTTDEVQFELKLGKNEVFQYFKAHGKCTPRLSCFQIVRYNIFHEFFNYMKGFLSCHIGQTRGGIDYGICLIRKNLS